MDSNKKFTELLNRFEFDLDEKDIEYIKKLSNIEEEWKKIKISEEPTNYIVSNLGFVYNTKLKKFIGHDYKDKYLSFQISLHEKRYRAIVHRMVAIYFCDIPKDLKWGIYYPMKVMPNHIDGIKHHNAAFNLEWTTARGNSLHAWKTGLNDGYKGENSHLAKIDERTARKIIEMIMDKKRNAEISEKLHVNRKVIQHIRSKESWKWLSEGLEFPKLADNLHYTIPDEKIRKICEELEKGELNTSQIGRKYGVKREYVKSIKYHTIRNDISSEYDF